MHGGYDMKGLIQVVVGLLLIVAVLYAMTYTSWFWAAVRLVQGGVVILVFLIGIGLILLGASEMKM